MEPVVAAPEEPYSIREEDLPQIMDEYDRLAKEFVKRQKEGRGFKFFHFMLDLSQGPCVAKRLSGCGSGTEYLAVTPWEIYIRATSSLEMKSSCLETWIPAWSTRRCAMNSSSATYTRKRNAKLFCEILLQRRMCGKFLQFPRQYYGCLRYRL